MKKHLKKLSLFLILSLLLAGCGNNTSQNTTSLTDLSQDSVDTQADTTRSDTMPPDDTTEQDRVTTDAVTEAATDTVSETTAATVTEAETTTTPETEAPKPTPTCTHATTKLTGALSATCAKEGYTGDKYCSKCNALIEKGATIQKTAHRNTGIINKSDATLSDDGYTGDTYCDDCKSIIQTGSTIPKTGVKITSKTYGTLYVDKSIANDPAEIRRYTMKLVTKSADHQYEKIEKEILRLVNIERSKEGLGALVWYEDAYYFTKIRAEECFTLYEHKRPNGTDWYTVYQNANVWLNNPSSENLYKSEGWSVDYYFSQGKTLEDIALDMVTGWMNSPSHRAAIMTAEFKEIAVAVIVRDDVIVGVQNFFG